MPQLSVPVNADQYHAIADCLRNHLNFREKYMTESQHVFDKIACQQGLRFLIKENLIDLVELSQEILRKHSVLVPDNILFEISLQVK